MQYPTLILAGESATLRAMDGETLRRQRKALGYSQAELGVVLGVPQNTISRWERGATRIQHPMILALALMMAAAAKRDALGVEPRELLKGAEGD